MARLLLTVILLLPRAALSQATDSIYLPDLGPLRTLVVADMPLLSIGDGRTPEYELSRVGGVVRLSDGRIAVLNGGTSELRVFSPQGEFICAVGGRGQGPGEFMSADRLFIGLADSLIVWDSRSARVSVLTPSCTFARTVPLDPRPGVPRLEGVDEQGRFLVVATDFRASASAEITRLPESRMLYGPGGRLLDTIGTSPGVSGVVHGTSDRVEILRPLVAPTTTYALLRATLWIETGESRRLERVDLTSGSRQVVTWGGPDLTMTPGSRKAIVENLVAGVPPDRRSGYRASLEARPVPKTIPATSRVLTDGSGRAWLEVAPTPGRATRSTWVVFGIHGRPEARLELPSSISLQAVVSDTLLVVERDAFDIEYVKLYRFGGT